MGAGSKGEISNQLSQLGHAKMDEVDDYDDNDEYEDETLNDDKSSNDSGHKSRKSASWFNSMMINFVGKNELEGRDLGPVMEQLRQRLMSKNVAEEIASKLVASIESALLGQKLDSFTETQNNLFSTL